MFVGDAQIQVFAGTQKIAKKTLCEESGCSAYYSYDPPTPATSLSAPGFNRLGGNLTITAASGGFRQFRSSVTPVFVNPNVNIGDIDFLVNTVGEGTPSTINGNVLRAGPEIRSCVKEGVVPCKDIIVRNPGGRRRDRVRSNVPLYNLLPGPPPVPQAINPNLSLSIGGERMLITGSQMLANLDFTEVVQIGGLVAPILTQSRSQISVLSPPHFASGGNVVRLFDIDNAVPGGTTIPGGEVRYDPTPVREIAGVYVVGPGEAVDLQGGSLSVGQVISCILAQGATPPSVLVTATSRPPNTLAGVVAFRADGSLDCRQCTCGDLSPPCPTNRSGAIAFTLVNTFAPADTRLRLRVSRTATVPFEPPRAPGLPPRLCSQSF